MPKLNTFAVNYAAFFNERGQGTLVALNEWLAAIQEPKFWEERASAIYSPDNETRKNPERHPIPSPIHSVRVRVKEYVSAFRKLRDRSDRNDALSYGFGKRGLEHLGDIIGARVVVYFPHQLAWIDAAIRESTFLELIPGQRPKSYNDASTLERLGLNPERFDARDRKTSGYSSLHYSLRLQHEGDVPLSKSLAFEVQVRTIAEELWGEIEHHIGYKPERRTAFSVQRQFRVISEHLRAVDMHLDFIYDEMQHFQSNMILRPEDQLNAENIPVVFSELQIPVTQNELGRISELMTAYKISTIEQLQSAAPYQCLSDIKDAWRLALPPKYNPTAEMTLTVLLSFRDPPGKDAIRASVSAFMGVYDALRSHLEDYH